MRESSIVLAIAVLASVSGCAIVPAYQRGAFVAPAMDPMSRSLATRSLRRLHTSRESASGGDGLSAGGGCACGN
ncbi:MAG: DUF4266 domain-containing protein [Myxococcota bacterium]|nr:DUF4266 domain-containing protein [Myxococcota bacterium]